MNQRTVIMAMEDETTVPRNPAGVTWVPPGAELHLMPKQPNEQEIAMGLANRVRAKLEEVCAIQTEACRAGFEIGFTQGKDGFGRVMITSFAVVKKMDV